MPRGAPRQSFFCNRRKRAPILKTSELTRFDLYRHKISWLLTLMTRLLVVAVLITVIVLGSTSQIFQIGTTTLLGYSIDPDLQLALIGLVNKLMDLLVTTCLENLAGVLLTLSMTCAITSIQGVHVFDFKMDKEMTTPWHAISAFTKRTRVLGWRWQSILRFVICLVVSICVLLQALAINTLGIPKERWYPGTGSLASTHPLPRFQGQGMDWQQYWDSAWSMVGGGDQSWHVADGLIAGSTISVFRTYQNEMLSQPRGWRAFGNDSSFAALDTRYNSSFGRGMAAHSDVIYDIYQQLKNSSDQAARISVGWTGNLTLELPSAAVSCGQYRNLTGTGTVVVSRIPDDDYSRAWFELSVTPLAADQTYTKGTFQGVNCNVSFERMQYPVEFWITNGAGTASMSINQYDTVYDNQPVPVPLNDMDIEIAKRLSIQVQATTARLESLVNNATAAQLYTGIARNLWEDRTEYQTDAEALAPVVTLLTTQLLAMGNWNVSYTNATQATSSPVRWQLFGSGPRLGWEWSSSVILGVLLLAMLFGIVLSLLYPIVPGPWLEVAGMLVAANNSSRMPELQKSMIQDEKETEKLAFYVRQDAVPDNVAIITDSLDAGALLRPRTLYKWPN